MSQKEPPQEAKLLGAHAPAAWVQSHHLAGAGQIRGTRQGGQCYLPFRWACGSRHTHVAAGSGSPAVSSSSPTWITPPEAGQRSPNAFPAHPQSQSSALCFQLGVSKPQARVFRV